MESKNVKAILFFMSILCLGEVVVNSIHREGAIAFIWLVLAWVVAKLALKIKEA